ncbi:MAG: RHS repeat-associated core domain-containing protein [Phycisphaerales bacterium]
MPPFSSARLSACAFPAARTLVALGVAVSASLAHAQTLLETVSVNSYYADVSTVQNVRMEGLYRGVSLDGTLLEWAGPWALAANPAGEAWNRMGREGNIRLATWSLDAQATDLALPAPGFSWTVGRSHNSRQNIVTTLTHRDSNGYQGYNWFQSSQPEIMFVDGSGTSTDTVYLVYGADRFAEFLYKATDQYKGVMGNAGVFKRTSGSPDTWVYYDQRGLKTTFFGGNTSSNRANWQLWKIEDQAGNIAYAGDPTTASTAVTSGYDASGRLTTAYDSADRRYTYTHSGSTIGGAIRLTQVIVETRTGGTWASPTGVSEVARVDYDHYTSDDSGKGLTGDLKLVTTTTPLSDGTTTIVRKQYYRYYTTTWSNSDGARGSAHQIKMIVDPDGARRYDLAVDSTLDDDFLTATDTDLKPYSSAFVEYVSSSDLRVAKAFFNGQCGCGGGNNGVYEFSGDDYVGDSTTYDPEPKEARAIIKQPDGKYVTQYFDSHGQPISRIVTTTDPATSVATRWVDHVIRNSDGAVFKHLTPEANDTYTHSTMTIVALASTGDANVTKPITSGILQGFLQGKRKDTGNPGTPDSTSKYVAATVYSGSTRDFEVVASGEKVSQPVVTAMRVYPGSTTNINDSASYNETAIATDYWSSTVTDPAYLATMIEMTTHPTVATANNGSNAATTSATYYRKDGTTAFTKDAHGHYVYTQYNVLGQVVKQIRDVKTSQTSDFAAADATAMTSTPGWGIATSGGTSGTGTHLITSYAYDAQGRIDTVTAPDGRISKMYYTRLGDGRSVTLSIPRMTTGGSTTFYGPVGYSVANQAGKPEFSATVAISSSGITTGLSSWVTTSGTDPITALTVGTIVRLTVNVNSSDGHRVDETRQYFSIPSSGAGTEGTHYDATRFGYDDMGRQWRIKNPAGTITRTKYDDRGRVIERWTGTNDSSFPAGDSGTDNMVKVEAIEYDSGSAGGNGLVTKRTGFIDSTTTGRRDTSYLYDDRGRPVVTIGAMAPHTVVKYDNLGRVTAAATYSSTSGLTASTDPTSTATNRLSLSKTFYDEKGQVYETRQYQINQSTGAIVQVSSQDVYLTSLTWYDDHAHPIKTRGASISKTAYDRLDRPVASYSLATDNDSTYADAATLSGDVVLEESHTTYDDASGTVVLQWSVARRHDDLGSGTTGALDSNADSDPLKVTAGNVKGRVSIQAMWYDALNRLTDTAVYGTNGIVGDGVADAAKDFNRSGLSVPSRSDTVLVSSTTYDTDGSVLETTDPRGLKMRFEYDKAGRKTKEIKNYVDGTAGGGTNADQDQIVTYQYTAGRMTKMTAVMPSGGTNQETTYTYGVPKGTGAGDSKIASSDLLWKVQYPDSSGGSDLVAAAYNAQGQEIYKADQAGNVVQTDYDDAGRMTHKRATTVASGFDTTVRRISMTYLARGQTELVSQYDNAAVGSGSVYNEVKYTYDEWGNITKFQQDRDSAVAGSGGDERAVEFAFSKVGSGAGSQRTAVRRTGMTLPGGASVAYTYSSSSNSLDDAYGRVTKVSLGGTDVAEYRYLGTSRLVGTALKTTTADTASNFYGSTGSASYATYMDAFGRIIKNTWVKGLGTPVTLMDLALTYDRNGNITSVADGVLSGFDAKYGMDDLNRVIDTDEGTLASGSITSRTRREQWTLGQTGNSLLRKRDLDGDGAWGGTDELNDTGTFNVANEWLTRDTDSTPGTTGNNHTLTHDAAGNLTDDGTRYTYVYDAFGRMVSVKNRSTSAVVAEYRYDGLGQRVAWHGDFDADGTVESTSDDPWYVFVYDDQWRGVATYRTPTWGGTLDANPKETFLYHAAGVEGRGSSSYIDSVILRERDANGNGGWRGQSDGTLEERRFYGQNWRADVVLFMKATGRPIERVKYSAYGLALLKPGYDYNADGVINPDDLGDIITDASSGSPPASADWNLDGTPNTTDSSEYQTDYYTINSPSWGFGHLTLADTGNRKGYAGYELDPLTDKYHVRHRVYDAELGRWTRRDPLGYVDGPSLLEYVGSSPLGHTDWDGLIVRSTAAFEPCHKQGCRATYGSATFEYLGMNCPCSWTLAISTIAGNVPPPAIMGVGVQQHCNTPALCSCGGGCIVTSWFVPLFGGPRFSCPGSSPATSCTIIGGGWRMTSVTCTNCGYWY